MFKEHKNIVIISWKSVTKADAKNNQQSNTFNTSKIHLDCLGFKDSTFDRIELNKLLKQTHWQNELIAK